MSDPVTFLEAYLAPLTDGKPGQISTTVDDSFSTRGYKKKREILKFNISQQRQNIEG